MAPDRSADDVKRGRIVRTSSRFLAALVLPLALGGCAGLPWSEPEPDPRDAMYAEGIAALDAGDFAGAEDRFRRLASRCESGQQGRSSLLALVTLKLDLRNPDNDPDEAARLAAIHLSLPDAPAAQRSLARTLYLLSVYRGARPVEGPEDLERPRRNESSASGPIDTTRTPGDSAGRMQSADTAMVRDTLRGDPADTVAGPADTAGAERPTPDAAQVDTTVAVLIAAPPAAPRNDTVRVGPVRAEVLEPARRFDRCELAGVVEVAWRGVPDYPGVPPIEWSQSDTVVVVQDRGGAGQSAALQARVRVLEAELARVRKLLKGGGGEGPDPRP